MPQMATISLPDSNNAYHPAGIDANGVASFFERSAGVAIGYKTLTVSAKPVSKVSRKQNMRVKLVLPNWYSPVVQGGISMPVKNFENVIALEASIHEASTRGEREQLLATMRAYINSAYAEALILDGQGFYG